MARKKQEPTTTLTKAEEQVMQAVWQVGKGFAGDIAAAVEEPKPAYRTVLTEIRILEQKGTKGLCGSQRFQRQQPVLSPRQS